MLSMSDIAGGLVVATITYGNSTLALFISTRDLPARFRNNNGDLFTFQDTSPYIQGNTYDLYNAILVFKASIGSSCSP
jgi:hypothetical protein